MQHEQTGSQVSGGRDIKQSLYKIYKHLFLKKLANAP
jgi:hypothetical protein